MDATTQEIQTEFKAVMEELQLRVKALRDLKEELEQERNKYGEELGETKASVAKLEKEIVALTEQQKRLNEAFHSPKIEPEEVKEDAQLRAFLNQCRYMAQAGDPLSEEERKALYPDGRRYSIPSEPGEWRVLTPEQARALVENTTGEILVPESFDTTIIRSVEETSIMRSLATVRTTTSNRERYRKMTEFTVAYGTALELGGSVTESDITPSEHYQYIEDAYGLTWLGVNELADSDVNLVSYIADSFARARREVEDEKFLIGAGHSSKEPQGLIDTSTITTVEAAGATAITFDDLQDLMYGYETTSSTPLKDVYRRNGVFIMHPFTELAVMKLTDSAGQYLWQPAIQAGQPNAIRGHAVYTTTNMDTIAATKATVWFGDVRSAYRIIDRLGMTMQRLVEVKATAGLVGFLFHWRNTGGIVRAEAGRILVHPAS